MEIKFFVCFASKVNIKIYIYQTLENVKKKI